MSRACGVGQQESVLYGWGKGAPGLELPEGVGFSVGPGSGISTVVMQVGGQVGWWWGGGGMVVVGW